MPTTSARIIAFMHELTRDMLSTVSLTRRTIDESREAIAKADAALNNGRRSPDDNHK